MYNSVNTKIYLTAHFQKVNWDFPGGLLVRMPCFHCTGMGSIPYWGIKILYASGCGKKKKKVNFLVYK